MASSTDEARGGQKAQDGTGVFDSRAGRRQEKERWVSMYKKNRERERRKGKVLRSTYLHGDIYYEFE